MTTPRILFICTQMEAGGVQRRATSMAAHFQAAGIPTRVVFLYQKRPAYDDLPFCSSILMQKPRGIREILTIGIALISEIKRFRPSAIIGMAHYSSPIAGFMGLLFGIKNRIATQTNPPNSVPLLGRLADLVCGSLGFYTRNICASHSIQRMFLRYPSSYRSRLITVVNGVKPFRGNSLSQESARAVLGLPKTGKVILNCGRLSAQKNQALLIRCMKKITASLVIVGDGELREALEQERDRLGLKDKVFFLGELPPSEMGVVFAAADIFVFPSLFEAFGLAAVEAMQAGLPVVGGCNEGLIEVVGDAGILLDPTNENGWVEVIAGLLSDPQTMRQLGAKSLQRAAEYSFTSMASGFLQAATER